MKGIGFNGCDWQTFSFCCFFNCNESVLEDIACIDFPSSLNKTYSNLDGFLRLDVSTFKEEQPRVLPLTSGLRKKVDAGFVSSFNFFNNWTLARSHYHWKAL